ncbi:protein FAR-RED IMPAIRED RESPONSE 1-like [Andrographis paniculata]|uniref:protein FAR-RED IMPAIRED RESPONSE 1-like n=1 Tax=Andrographis paniculata TaxID=175694 RepID=UPI0021E96FE9|nr:protein FAR-RED IMPAIRED RESPONSE 1-like [Andrographis paniculata]
MREDYALFRDSITFDTTYQTNKNHIPLGVFVGFNNHRQTSIFGAALLYEETQDSFKWVFNTFLKCMGGQAPKTIFSDQDLAMAPALRETMPTTYHALCTWHIVQNAKKNLSALYTTRFAEMFQHILYGVQDENQFSLKWEYMLQACFPKGPHKWLLNIYSLRQQWSSAWTRQHFTARMRTTQLSESLNFSLKMLEKATYKPLSFSN